jgi:ssRNA-specific RNase YbeY (16S rRNA maturation enzyme)
VLYLVHGLLHLVGYDDLSAHEKVVMRQREREVLGLCGLTPRYAD